MLPSLDRIANFKIRRAYIYVTQSLQGIISILKKHIATVYEDSLHPGPAPVKPALS